MLLKDFETEMAFTTRTLGRGKKLYEQGRVIRLIENEHGNYSTWSGQVKGQSGKYKVEVELNNSNEEVTDLYCDCPYDWDGYCKHIVAVLFEIREILEEVLPIPVKEEKVSVKKKGTAPVSGIGKPTLEAYDQLNFEDQVVALCAALIWEKFDIYNLLQAYNPVSRKGELTLLSSWQVEASIKKLMQLDMVRREKRYFRCNPAFADQLCKRESVQSPYFEEIALVIANHHHPFSGWNSFNDPNRWFRQMRIGAYLGKLEIFQAGYFKLLQINRQEYTPEKLIDYWIGIPLNEKRANAMKPSILAYLLTHLINLGFFTLQPLDEQLMGYCERMLAELPQADTFNLAITLCRVRFFQGDHSRLKASLPYLGQSGALAQSALDQLLMGKAEESLETFGQARKRYGKVEKSRNIALPGFFNVFHQLAKLAQPKPGSYARILKNLKKQLEEKHPDQMPLVYLEALALFLNNQSQRAEQRLEQPIPFAFNEFFYYFTAFWINPDLIDLPSLEDFTRHATSAGYLWMATQLHALQKELGQPVPEEKLPEGVPLHAIIRRRESWEIALDALLGMTQGGQAAPGTQNTHRIAWLVDFENKLLQARHQKLGKNGWTKGRPVSFDRLQELSLEGMSPQDIRFVQSVGYSAGSEIYVGDRLQLWRNLIGHPYLFLKKSSKTAVQLQEGKPSLIARKTEKGYRLQFTHGLLEAGPRIVRESPTRYLYLEVSEQMARIANAFNGESLELPSEAESRLKEALSGLSHMVPVQSVFEDEKMPSVEADNRICVHLLPVGDGFHIELYIKPFRDTPTYVKPGKGEPYLIGMQEGNRMATTRDLKAEKNNLTQFKKKVPLLREIIPVQDIWQLEEAETCLQLLMELRPLVEAEEIIMEWPKGEKLAIRSVNGFDSFRLAARKSGHWFELEGELRVDEETVLSLQDLLALSQGESRFVEISPGKFLALTEEFHQKLRGVNGMLGVQKKGGKVQLHPLAVTAIESFTEAIEELDADSVFHQQKEKLKKAFSRNFRLPGGFLAKLRDYQKEGYLWLRRCAEWGVGACLADDMGLGKTIQALALLCSRASKGPALVVAPASVCRNWMAETERFAPKLNPLLFSESDRKKIIQKAKNGDVIIVTYDLMGREADLFTGAKWATVILDEAQAIKNRTTIRSKTAMALNAGFRLAMTGTPLENHLGELWNLFQFLNPGLLGRLEEFNERFAAPIERDRDENRREQLRRLVQPFILRRRKDEVLKELPEKTEITLTVDLSKEELAFYEALRRNALEKLTAREADGQSGPQHLRILAEIMRLRRAACHPSLAKGGPNYAGPASKLELFGEIVDEILDSGHKALVFSQFVDHLRILEKHLQSKNIAYQYLDGQTPGKKRQKAIDAFQSGEGDVFLISLKAGGTGLNLTAADYVIHTDPWWNPAVEDQATDRAHRIGQTRPVTAYRLVAARTIEEKILELHAQKRDLADSLLAGTDVSARLSAEEMMKLLKEE
jgi:superfamily II DNA or RNA helicase